MLLTIGMIVKNEEKYLRRCLNALLPILRSIKSELIIADTGSADSTFEIAGEFTDKVFKYDWADDFAAARNSVIRRAKGMWFMAIDADEILESPEEIIGFFKSGEYKYYRSATYIIRNVISSGNELSSDLNAIRILRLEPDTRYVNAVHEQFEKINGPTKYLRAVVRHYGYSSDEDNKEHLKFKINRNLELLFKELREKPKECTVYLHLSNAYGALEEYEKAIDYALRGLKLSVEQKNSLLYVFYFNVIFNNFQLEKYQIAVDLCNEYFHARPKALGMDLEIYMLKADSCYHLGMFADAADSFYNYLKFYMEFIKGSYRTIDTFQHSMKYTSEYHYRYAVIMLARSYIKLGDLLKAEGCLALEDDDRFLSDKYNIKGWIDVRLDIMEIKREFASLAELYDSLDENSAAYMREVLEPRLDTDLNSLILNSFSNENVSSGDYKGLMRLRYEFSAGIMNKASVLSFICAADMSMPVYADAAYFAVISGVDIKSIASVIDADDVGKYFYNNSYHHFKDIALLVCNALKGRTGGKTTETKVWLEALFYKELISNALTDDSGIGDIFRAFCLISVDVAAYIFNDEFLSDDMVKNLPKRYRAGFYCGKAIHYAENGNINECTGYFKKVKALDPRLGRAADSYISTL